MGFLELTSLLVIFRYVLYVVMEILRVDFLGFFVFMWSLAICVRLDLVLVATIFYFCLV